MPEKKLIQIIGGEGIGKTVAIGSFYNELIREPFGINFAVKFAKTQHENFSDIIQKKYHVDDFIPVHGALGAHANRLFRPTVRAMARLSDAQAPTCNWLNGTPYYTLRGLIPATAPYNAGGGEAIQNSIFQFLRPVTEHYAPICEINAFDFSGGRVDNFLLDDATLKAYQEYEFAGFIVVIPTLNPTGLYDQIIRQQLEQCNNFIAGLERMRQREGVNKGVNIRISEDFLTRPLIFLMTRFDSTILLNPDGTAGPDVDTMALYKSDFIRRELERGHLYANINKWRGEKFFVPMAATSRDYITSASYLNADSMRNGLSDVLRGEFTNLNTLPQCYDFYGGQGEIDPLALSLLPPNLPGVNDIETRIPNFFWDKPLEPWNASLPWLLILERELANGFLNTPLNEYMTRDFRNGFFIRYDNYDNTEMYMDPRTERYMPPKNPPVVGGRPTIQDELAEAKRQRDKLQSELDKLQSELEVASTELTDARKGFVESQRKLVVARRERDKLKSELEVAKRQRDKLKSGLEDARKKLAAAIKGLGKPDVSLEVTSVTMVVQIIGFVTGIVWISTSSNFWIAWLTTIVMASGAVSTFLISNNFLKDRLAKRKKR